MAIKDPISDTKDAISDTLDEVAETSPDTTIVDNVSGTLESVSEALAKGRDVAVERVPVMIDATKQAVGEAQASAKQVIDQAQANVDRLSDTGITAAAGFALGVSAVLLLTGAPRIFLVASALPVALTLRAAASRGIRPATLMGNPGTDTPS